MIPDEVRLFDYVQEHAENRELFNQDAGHNQPIRQPFAVVYLATLKVPRMLIFCYKLQALPILQYLACMMLGELNQRRGWCLCKSCDACDYVRVFPEFAEGYSAT